MCLIQLKKGQFMVKFLKITALMLFISSCANFVERSNAITSKIGKKKGTCSPLDKAQSKPGCIDEKFEERKRKISNPN